MSEAIENVRLGLSELGIDVPPGVTDEGLKDYLDDILEHMRERSAGDASVGRGATGDISPGRANWSSRLPTADIETSSSIDLPPHAKPRTKTLREMVPFPKKKQLVTPSLYSTSEASCLYSARDSESDFPEPSTPFPDARSSLPASLSLGGGSTPNESEENSSHRRRETESDGSPHHSEVGHDSDPIESDLSDSEVSDGVSDGSVSGGVSSTRRVLVGTASNCLSHPRLQRGRLMNVVSAIPVHPPARASVRTPRSARSHSTNSPRARLTASSSRPQSRASARPHPSRAPSTSARRSHSHTARARPAPQPRPYGLSTDRDRFRRANERSESERGVGKHGRDRKRLTRHGYGCRYDTGSDSESESESGDEYDHEYDENEGNDVANRRRPPNPLIDKIHRRRKTKAGIKSTDPVALYQYFQKQWKNDRFLAKKNGGRRS